MKPLIIDTRETFEYQQSHAEGAVNITPGEFMNGDFMKKLHGVDKDTQIILYCRSGARSNTAAHILRERGFTNIINGVNEQRVQKLIGE